MRAGSTAAAVQSSIGSVVAPRIFATNRRAAAVGHGNAVVSAATQGISGVGGWCLPLVARKEKQRNQRRGVGEDST